MSTITYGAKENNSKDQRDLDGHIPCGKEGMQCVAFIHKGLKEQWASVVHIESREMMNTRISTQRCGHGPQPFKAMLEMQHPPHVASPSHTHT